MKTIYLLASLLLFFGCNNKDINWQNTASESIKIDVDEIIDEIDGSYLLDTTYFNAIALETTEEALLGGNIRVYIRGNKLLVYDQTSQALYIFTDDGKYHAKVDYKGVGPGEYPHLNDIVVTKKFIGVLSPSVGKILLYDFDGKHVKDVIIKGSWGYSFFTLDEKDFYLVGGFSVTDNGCYFVYTIDSKSGKIAGSFPFDEKYVANRRGWALGNYFSLNKDTALFIVSTINTVFEINKDYAAPKYNVDIVKNKLPSALAEGDAEIAFDEAIKNNYIKGIYKIAESSSYLFLDFLRFQAIYNKKDKSVVLTSRINTPYFCDKLALSPLRHNLENDILTTSYYAENIENLKETQRIKFGNKEMNDKFYAEVNKLKDEDDNPILLFYKLK